MKIPSVQTRQNVGRVTLKGTKKTAADFGAAFAQPLAQAGQALQQVAVKEFQSANIAAVQDAESQLYQFENDSLYGENGLYSRKGKDAMGASDELMASFDERSAKILESLTNDQQRQAFKNTINARKKDLLRSSSRYQYTELQGYKAEQAQAYVANSQVAAANNYRDPERVNEEIKRQTDSVRATGIANGDSEEVIGLKVGAAKSTTYSSIVKRFLSDKNYAGAKAYFEQHKDSILPQQRDALQAQVEIGDVRAKSQISTDSIVAMGLDEKGALAEARKISDPEVRDQTVTRIKTRYAEQEAYQREFEAKNFDDAANIVEQTGDSSNVPPEMWGNLTISQRSSLDARAKQLSTNEAPTTDWKLWTKLNEMSNEELLQVNLWEYRPNLSDVHYQQFSNEQQKIKALIAEGQRNPELSSTLTFKDQTKQVAGAAGIVPIGKTPAKWSEDESLRYGLFQTEAAKRIEAFEYEKGAKATGQERQQILDKMVVESVKIKEWGSDPELFLYEVTEDDKGNAYVPYSDIPDGEVKSARNLIRSRGLSPTKERIQRIYAAMLLNDRLLAEQILEGN